MDQVRKFSGEFWTPDAALGSLPDGGVYLGAHASESLVKIDQRDILGIACELHRRSATFVTITAKSKVVKNADTEGNKPVILRAKPRERPVPRQFSQAYDNLHAGALVEAPMALPDNDAFLAVLRAERLPPPKSRRCPIVPWRGRKQLA